MSGSRRARPASDCASKDSTPALRGCASIAQLRRCSCKPGSTQGALRSSNLGGGLDPKPAAPRRKAVPEARERDANAPPQSEAARAIGCGTPGAWAPALVVVLGAPATRGCDRGRRAVLVGG